MTRKKRLNRKEKAQGRHPELGSPITRIAASEAPETPALYDHTPLDSTDFGEQEYVMVHVYQRHKPLSASGNDGTSDTVGSGDNSRHAMGEHDLIGLENQLTSETSSEDVNN